MPIDWKKCIICQESNNEVLKCPLNGNGSFEVNCQVSSAFLENVRAFKQVGLSPVQLSLDDDITVESLCQNRASWHKPCHLKFSISKLKKAEERINRKRNEKIDTNIPQKIRRRSDDQSIPRCIFCDSTDESISKLRSFAMLETGENISKMALELGKFDLLGRMANGDLIAIEAKYHLRCLVGLRNEYRSHCNKKIKDESEDTDRKIDESVAFRELIEYIDQCMEDGNHIFRLSDLSQLYVERLKCLGIDKSINKTRLKNSLLEHFNGALQEQNDGKNVILVFGEAISHLLKDALNKRNYNKDAEILAKAATIVRKDIISHKTFSFSGNFSEDCQSSCIPASLRSLISMIINGLDIKAEKKKNSQMCSTVCEMLIFNSKKWPSRAKSTVTRHSLETPLPLYIGLKIHNSTRSKVLIEQMYKLGLSVSYYRVIEVEEELSASLCQRFDLDGVVVPSILKKGIFTAAALDNLDHNPSSNTSTSSFHGTGISLFQFPTEDVPGEPRPPLIIPPAETSNIRLPEHYASVPAVAFNPNTVSCPPRSCQSDGENGNFTQSKVQEIAWLEHGCAKLKSAEITAEDTVTWSSFHSKMHRDSNNPPGITSLLPLFYEKADTPAMIKHGMDVIREATNFLNPGQIPIITLDQPLFAIAKGIQWKWPENYGEDAFVVMFGGLHLEMACWCTIGDLLDGSGWTTILSDAEITSSGIAQGLLKSSHLKRTRLVNLVMISLLLQ